jgi:hypothetical protein
LRVQGLPADCLHVDGVPLFEHVVRVGEEELELATAVDIGAQQLYDEVPPVADILVGTSNALQ